MSKGLEAVTGAGLKEEAIVASFKNRTQRRALCLITLRLCFSCHLVQSGAASPRREAGLEGWKSLLLNLRRRLAQLRRYRLQTQVKCGRRRLGSSAGGLNPFLERRRSTAGGPESQAQMLQIVKYIWFPECVCSVFECREAHGSHRPM